MERIVFLDRQSLKAELRRPAFPHHWEEHAQTLEQTVADRLAGATVAITNKVPIRRATLDKLPNLKLIAMAAIGYDVIDVDACRDQPQVRQPVERGPADRHLVGDRDSGTREAVCHRRFRRLRVLFPVMREARTAQLSL